jgi:hypothetical protein
MLALVPTVQPDDAANKSILWSSSDTAVATVNSVTGVVTGKAPGTATITATAQDGSGVSASCEVTVYQPVTSVSLRTATGGGTAAMLAPLVLTTGAEGEVFPVVYPADAGNQSVTLSSADERVTTVSEREGRWFVTGGAPGWTTVTATSEDGGFTSSVLVVVEDTSLSDEPAASIGVTHYATLDGALAAVQDGDTIVLLKDQVHAEDVTLAKSCSLDLGGKTLYTSRIAVGIRTGGTREADTVSVPEISNGTLVWFGRYDGALGTALSVTRGSSLSRLHDVTVYGGVGVAADDNNSAEIEEIRDCTIYGTVGVSEGGFVGIYDGSVIGDGSGRALGLTGHGKTGTAAIYGGTFNGTVGLSFDPYTTSELRVYGGRFDRPLPASRYIYFGSGLWLNPVARDDGYYYVEEHVESEPDLHRTATFNLSTPGSQMVLTDFGDTPVTPDGSSSATQAVYSLLLGETYHFEVSATGHESKSGSFVMQEAFETSIGLEKAAEQQYVAPGDTILFGGTYYLKQGDGVSNPVNGTVSVLTTEPVTIVGRGISNTNGTSFSFIDFDCAPGTDIAIQDLFLGRGTFHFTGEANTLTVKGENILDMSVYGTYGFIHVPKGSELTIQGDGTLYGYKYSQGAGIGGGTDEAGGRITFNVAHLYIKGSKTGALIGGDAGMTLATQGVRNDDITIAGGEVVLVNKARGDAIGDGYLSSSAGSVYLTGGNLTIITDFEGAGIAGNLTVTGGSFKAVRTGNSLWTDNTTRYQVLDYSKVTFRYTSDGEHAYVLAFDTALLSDAADSFDVKIDGEPFYSGGLHRYYYGESTSYTPDNFDIATPDSIFTDVTNTKGVNRGSGSYYDTRLYFLVGEGHHTLTVNGEKFTAYWTGTADTRYAGSFTVAASEPAPKAGQPGSGDFDGDGSVTASDALVAATSVIGSAVLTDAQRAAVDIDGDGALTMADVVLIMRKAMGL